MLPSMDVGIVDANDLGDEIEEREEGGVEDIVVRWLYKGRWCRALRSSLGTNFDATSGLGGGGVCAKSLPLSAPQMTGVAKECQFPRSQEEDECMRIFLSLELSDSR